MEYRTVLGYPAYRNLWIATGIGSIGSRLFGFAFIWLVFEFTTSPTMLAVALAVVALPEVFSTVLGGIIADRVNRIRVIIWSELLRAALLPLIPLLAIHDLRNIILVGILIGLVSTFEAPARGAVVPNLVPDDELDEANGLLQLLMVTSYTLYIGAGWLVMQIGAPTVMLISAIPSVLAVFVLLWIPSHLAEPEEMDDDEESVIGIVLSDFRMVYDLVRSNGVLASLLVLQIAHLFVIAPIGAIIMPVFAVQEFGGDSFVYGVLYGSFYAGMFFGAGVFGQLTDEREVIHGHLVVWGTAISGLFLTGMALAPALLPLPFTAAVVLHGLAGVATFHAVVAVQTLLQLIPSDTERGKVFSMLTVISLVIAPLSYLTFGPVVTALGPTIVLAAIGVASALVGLAMIVTPLYSAAVDDDPSLGGDSSESTVISI